MFLGMLACHLAQLVMLDNQVTISMHAQVAEAKVDTLVMKHFLSGFSDADAKLILKHCKEVLPRHANILLLQVRHIKLTPVTHAFLFASIASVIPYRRSTRIMLIAMHMGFHIANGATSV